MDFFAITKNFWDNAPNTDGFKSDYAGLFFAIMDSVNRNLWNDTEIEYDRLINKTRLGKRMYLSGRQWLAENNYITFTKGMNDYARAKFNIVVQKCTSTDTTTVSSNAPQLHHNSTSAVPYLNKTLDNKTNKPINIGFEVFWNLYGKKDDRQKSEKKWNSLTDKERELAIEDIPKYIATLRDRQYQKNPLTYLNGKCWLDERETDQAVNKKNGYNPDLHPNSPLQNRIIV